MRTWGVEEAWGSTLWTKMSQMRKLFAKMGDGAGRLVRGGDTKRLGRVYGYRFEVNPTAGFHGIDDVDGKNRFDHVVRVVVMTNPLVIADCGKGIEF